MGIIFYINYQMTAVPCTSSYPAAAGVCKEKTLTYAASVSTADDGAQALDFELNWTAPTTDEGKAIEKASNEAPAGMMIMGWANEDVTLIEGTIMTKAKGAMAAPQSGISKCEKSIKDLGFAKDDKSWEKCAKWACATEWGKASQAKPYLCKDQKDAKSAWKTFGMKAGADKKSMKLSASAPANADGKDGLLDLSKKYNFMIGGFACSKDCKKVVHGMSSGWFPVAVSGAASLVAAGAVV